MESVKLGLMIGLVLVETTPIKRYAKYFWLPRTVVLVAKKLFVTAFILRL
jgi:hypothetical protein